MCYLIYKKIRYFFLICANKYCYKTPGVQRLLETKLAHLEASENIKKEMLELLMRADVYIDDDQFKFITENELMNTDNIVIEEGINGYIKKTQTDKKIQRLK